MTDVLKFNPNGPKVSTRRMRKQFGRFSVEAHRTKEYELNRGTEAEQVSLAQVEALHVGDPVGVL